MLRAGREQVVAFRAAALHLDRRLPAGALPDPLRPVGLQDTPPGNAAVAAAARVEDLTPDVWVRAVGQDKTLVGLWAMRGSSYVVPADDLPVFTAGLLPEQEESVLHRITSTFDEVVEEAGAGATELVDRLAERARHELAGRRLTKRELGRALAPAIPEPIRDRLDPDATAWGDYDLPSALALTVARLVAHRGVFVIAPRDGNELSFVRTDEWLGRTPTPITPAPGPSSCRRFLRAYAPATADFAWWTSEQTSARARRAHEADAERAWNRVAGELEEVEADSARGFVLAEDARRLDSPPEPEGVRLLPPHNPLMMLRDRDTLVPEPFHKPVRRAQHNPGVVLTASRSPRRGARASRGAGSRSAWSRSRERSAPTCA